VAPTNSQDWRRRAAGPALLLAGLIVATSLLPLHGWLVGLLPLAEDFIRAYPVAGVSAFVAYAAASAMLAFVSSALVVPVGVYVWGKAISLLLLLLGWVLGGMCTYTLGRFFGRPLVEAIATTATFQRYVRRFPHGPPFGLVVLFQLALPSEVPGYVLGLTRYDPRKFVAAVMLAELPYAAGAIYLGESFVERNIGALAGVGVAVVALSAFTAALLHRRLRAGRAEARDTGSQ